VIRVLQGPLDKMDSLGIKDQRVSRGPRVMWVLQELQGKQALQVRLGSREPQDKQGSQALLEPQDNQVLREILVYLEPPEHQELLVARELVETLDP
jgi:hypothetical protein